MLVMKSLHLLILLALVLPACTGPIAPFATGAAETAVVQDTLTPTPTITNTPIPPTATAALPVTPRRSANDIGGSAHGEVKGGLTAKGKAMIRLMEARKMIVDLAHASAATIDDTLAMATRPVVVSHTGVRGTCDNPRNLTDEQLKKIAATGGVIGIGYWARSWPCR